MHLVGDAGQALTRIAGQVAEINAIVTEIAASAQEQATGLQQVNTAVAQMDQVTQQNAAMVEESTAASHALARDAEELRRLMSQFEVGGHVAAPKAAASKSAAPSSRSSQAAAPAPAAKRQARAPVMATAGANALQASPVDDWEDF